MIRWLRCYLAGRGCPLPAPAERPRDTAIHEARSARRAIRGNAEQAIRLAAGEARAARETVERARLGPSYEGLYGRKGGES